MKKYLLLSLLLINAFFLLCSCTQFQQRGMAGANYVSTSHPSFAIGVRDTLPLLSGGVGNSRLTDSGILGGLPVDSWLATYGNSQDGPLAIIAHAELPPRWYWDAVSPHPFSVDVGVELIGNMGFDAWTYVVNDQRNPFWTPSEGREDNFGRWLVRCFAQRADFDRGKIVLEYRERLPGEITSISSMPFGYGDYLKNFAERARNVFVQHDAAALAMPILHSRASGIRWQYLDDKFWGTASPYSYYDKFR